MTRTNTLAFLYKDEVIRKKGLYDCHLGSSQIHPEHLLRWNPREGVLRCHLLQVPCPDLQCQDSLSNEKENMLTLLSLSGRTGQPL